jgi:3-methyladenine DNA glycosylase AlkC
VETRQPKGGQGVPKETREQNSIADLQAILEGHFPGGRWDRLPAELERRGFFEAGMQQQVRILAEAAVDLLEASHDPADLIPALSASPVEKVRGVAAFTVPLVHASDLEHKLQALQETGALEGTWPRELSATVLHNIVIQYGVATVLPRVQGWNRDPNPAVRRLVVEAHRPRGVMLAHITELKQDPTPLRALLEPVLDDASDYVRKAVANSLNDISRDNPEALLKWAREWMSGDPDPERRWVIARALRTLVSQGNRTALEILGYAGASDLEVVWKDTTPDSVELNQLVPFELEISNPGHAEALVNLVLTMDAPGKGKARRTSRFQLWKGQVPAGSSKEISKRIHFIDKSTQRKEPGLYRLVVALNGQEIGEREISFARLD